MINAAAAMELFGTDDAVGRRFGFQPEERGEIEVVGVVRDTRYDDLRGAPPTTVFRSAVQSPLRSATFAVRTDGPPSALTPAVRESIRQIDPRLPIVNVTTQTTAIEEQLSDERLYAVAYASFGGLATLLAAIGLFGLASYTVTRRSGEFGVRMALGASSTGIAWLVLRESLVLVAAGVAAGVGTVLLAGRLVASLIHGLAPTDPVTILQAAALLAGIAAAAAYLPARTRRARRPPDRAPGRVNPWRRGQARHPDQGHDHALRAVRRGRARPDLRAHPRGPRPGQVFGPEARPPEGLAGHLTARRQRGRSVPSTAPRRRASSR